MLNNLSEASVIPEALTWRIEQLRQPRLLQPICPNMLDRERLPSGSLLAAIDALIAEDAVQCICQWEMPTDLMSGTRPADRWRLVSSLQKAIRFGDIRAAMDAAHAAYEIDRGRLLKRLVVCAVEDVMLGNLYAVAVTLALSGDKPSRELAGERKTAVWLAAQLADGWKDRTACNLCVVVDFDRALHATMNDWAGLSDLDLAAKAADLKRPVEERMLAAWLLAGTKRYWNVNVPKENDRPRWSLMRLMVESGMPLILYWLADRAAARGGDCMFVSLLPIWQLLEGDASEPVLRQNDVRRGLMVGGVLTAAYDMHTREGQASLRHLAARPEVSEALKHIAQPESRLPALFAALFAVEGGKLNLRVSTSEIDRLHLSAISTELDYFGATTLNDQCTLLKMVGDNLVTLDALRLEQLALQSGTGPFEGSEANSLRTPYPQDQMPLRFKQAPQQPNPANLRILPDYELSSLNRFVWGGGELRSL